MLPCLLCGGCRETRGEAGVHLGGYCDIQLRDVDKMDRKLGEGERWSDLRYLVGVDEQVFLVDWMWGVKGIRVKVVPHL